MIDVLLIKLGPYTPGFLNATDNEDSRQFNLIQTIEVRSADELRSLSNNGTFTDDIPEFLGIKKGKLHTVGYWFRDFVGSVGPSIAEAAPMSKLIVVVEDVWEDDLDDPLPRVLRKVVDTYNYLPFGVVPGTLTCVASSNDKSLGDVSRSQMLFDSGAALILNNVDDAETIIRQIVTRYWLVTKLRRTIKDTVLKDTRYAFFAFLLFGIAQAIAAKPINWLYDSMAHIVANL